MFPLYSITFPCDHYTVAANMHGTWTGDALYLEALREIVLHFPELIILENVLGMRKFKRVMETFQALPFYYCTECVLYGDDFSLQRKARSFLILHRQPFAFDNISQRSNFPDQGIGWLIIWKQMSRCTFPTMCIHVSMVPTAICRRFMIPNRSNRSTCSPIIGVIGACFW